MITEVFHKYLDEELLDSDIQVLNLTKNLLNKKTKDVIILVDDIHIESKKLTESEIIFFVKNILNCNVTIYNESLMLKYVEGVLNTFKIKLEKEYFRKEDKYVYLINLNNKKIFLYEEKEGAYKYYCVLLSYTWCLFKLFGLCETTMKSYIDSKSLEGIILNRIHLIIQEDYKNIETNVLDLLKSNFVDCENLITVDYI